MNKVHAMFGNICRNLERELYLWRYRIKLFPLMIPLLILWAVSPIKAAPLSAIALQEGRTYDQAHDAGYIDWGGTVQYVYLTHRDGTSLPVSEGGASCSTNCTEWVTRLSNGSAASGTFDRDVSYFEIMVGFSRDTAVGNATLRACSSVNTWTLHNTVGTYPGFASMDIPVPAGCRSWSLTASGGYVDYRSIDVYYVALASTATATVSPLPTLTPTETITPTSSWTATVSHTPTLTFTPTFTSTNTATATATFTPTATYTDTPSSTPTPRPPQVTGVVVCDLWGDAGWCRGEETLELSASDPQGFTVAIQGDLVGIPFSCRSSCRLSLPEGIGTAHFVVTSANGRTANGQSTWQRDVTPPGLHIGLPPVNGRNGWYVSEVDVTAAATDSISGLLSLSGTLDDGWTWLPFPFHFFDGIHPLTVRAKDMAGNEVTLTNVIRVDTLPPTVRITSHTNDELVRGAVPLFGMLNDATSGLEEGEVSADGGGTWQNASLGTENTWSFLWQSSEVRNGSYELQVQGMDRAGNVSEPETISLTVDNDQPSVSITERWWIWETGQLMVSSNHFPVASVQVTILDLRGRWPAVVMTLDPGKASFPISWDRYFADGTLAPSGEYSVLAVACDGNGLCGRDLGRIVIPVAGTSAVMPSPSLATTATVTAVVTSTAVPMMPTSTLILETPIPGQPLATSRSSFPLWQIVGLLGLFLVIASTSVIDPRPKALGRLSETLRALYVQVKEDLVETNNGKEI